MEKNKKRTALLNTLKINLFSMSVDNDPGAAIGEFRMEFIQQHSFKHLSFVRFTCSSCSIEASECATVYTRIYFRLDQWF